MGNLIKLICIIISTLSANIVILIVLPFYPIVAARHGMTQSEIGLVFSIYPVFSLLASFKIGKVCSWIGSRNVVTIGILVNSLSLLGFAFLNNLSYKLFLLVSITSRAVGGLGLACIYVGNLRLIQRDYPNKRENYTSLMEAFGGMGLMLAPAYCSLMHGLVGFSGLYFIMFLILLMFCPIFWCNVKPNVRLQNIDESEDQGIVMKVNRNLSINFSMLMYGYFALCFLEPTASLYMIENGIDEETTGLVFSGCTMSYMLTNFFMAWLASFVKMERLSTGSLVICAGAMAFIGPISAIFGQIWITICGVIVNGIGVAVGFSCVMPAMIEEIKLCQFKKCGVMFELNSVYNIGINSGEIIGPAISGFLVDFLGFPMSCAVISCFGGGFLILQCFFRQKHQLSEPLLTEQNSLIINSSL